MKLATRLSLLAVAGLGVALAGRLAVSSSQSGALVRLQATTPGVSQAGHQNISGILRAGEAQIGPNARRDVTFHVSMYPEALDQQANGTVGQPVGTLWQSFKPAVSGHLSRIEFGYSQTAGNTTFMVQILEGEGEGGSVLAQSDVLSGGGPSLKSVDFEAPPQLQANSIYSLSVVTLSGSGLVTVSATDVYDRGASSFGGRDIFFRTYMLSQVLRDGILLTNNGNVGIGVSIPTSPLHVNGTITGTLKQFEIDHPLDPENRVLRHACIESSEIKNLYDGEVTTDKNGFAVVTVPDWFEALNGDVRYQLTCFTANDGSMVTANVARPLKNGSFAIRASKPFSTVCWQLTGVRKDNYALEHPLIVEGMKPQTSREHMSAPTPNEAAIMQK